MFANTPPSARQSVAETPKCNTGKGAVVLDGLMATVFAVSALAVASDSGEAAGVLLLPTLAYGGSAAVGNRNADACRAAVAAHDEY
ncbi:MAG: hypothetical protein KC464_32690, partial [Myxococcales bacterium]|nr:hypothetical protein [Myxococcales bacterium]